MSNPKTQRPDLAWMRRAAEKARFREGFIASISGDIEDVADDFAISIYQTCELFLCLIPRTYEEAETIAKRVGAKTDDVFLCFVVGER